MGKAKRQPARQKKPAPRELKWPASGTVEEQVWTRCRDGVLAHDIYSELEPTGIPRRSLITYVSNYRRWNRGGVKRAQRVLEYHPNGFLTIPLDAETWAIYQLEAIEQRISVATLALQVLTRVADEDLFGRLREQV